MASAGFTFFQEMPTSAVNDALIPVKAFFALHYRIRLAQLKYLYVAHVLNHLLGLFTKWVVGIILFLIGLKILSMRVILDLLHDFTNTRIFSLCHN